VLDLLPQRFATRYNKGMTVPFSSGLTHAPPPPQAVRVRDYPSRELKRGEVLYRLGDEGEAVFLIEEGLVKLSLDLVSGKERIISIAGPGDLVGALTPVHVRYQDSAEALSPRVRVTIIPSDQLDDASIRQAILTATGHYLGRLKEALEDSELPVEGRLARTFLRLGERFGQSTGDSRVRLTLPLTHENLAALIGAARETTTATLSEMRDEGLLQGTRGSYSFNPADLSEFALTTS